MFFASSCFFWFLFFLKLGTWADICCQSFSLSSSPQSATTAPPPAELYILVVGPSGCVIWDAASAWLDERCHVHARDLNWWNHRPQKQSMGTKGQRDGPMHHLVFCVIFSKIKNGGMIVVCIKYCISGLSGQEKWKFKHLYFRITPPITLPRCDVAQHIGRLGRLSWQSRATSESHRWETTCDCLKVSIKEIVWFHWDWGDIYRDFRELIDLDNVETKKEWIHQELQKQGSACIPMDPVLGSVHLEACLILIPTGHIPITKLCSPRVWSPAQMPLNFAERSYIGSRWPRAQQVPFLLPDSPPAYSVLPWGGVSEGRVRTPAMFLLYFSLMGCGVDILPILPYHGNVESPPSNHLL